MKKQKLLDGINRLRKERNAIILAHYYQEEDIQALADFVGDSLALAQWAAKTDAPVLVVCGVHFMGETAKIICPEKTVLIPDAKAGCTLADSCDAEAFRRFTEAHPDHTVISYVNTTAAIKALTDIVVTSTNARQIVESLPADTPIIFGPDRNLGSYISRITGRGMLLWDGACIVHDRFSARKIQQLHEQYPDAVVLAHPECRPDVLQLADVVASTSGLLNYVVKHPERKQFIVTTETGILYKMKQQCPDRTYFPAPAVDGHCGICRDMRRNTLEKLYTCLRDLTPAVTVDESLAGRALQPIRKMLDISAQLGL